ncbi:MAG: translation initiation factor IF-3 [Magnetococcales bacterium]|nr:translation initiation factor IF-3 [Magnetococcales bacterium]MBF0322280.1 translation initiation factor IF-3 [Magnetococcales bacterium]
MRLYGRKKSSTRQVTRNVVSLHPLRRSPAAPTPGVVTFSLEGTAISKQPVKDRGPQLTDTTRINEQIRVPEVRLIDENSEQVGIISRTEAMSRAFEVGLDLVEVAPEARPPVCKIMDYTKFKYQKAIRERQARKNQTRIDTKEVKFRPGTDIHDYDVKLRSIRKFLEQGNKVKCTLRFRGREMAHQELGMTLLGRLEIALDDLAKVEQRPRLMGRQMTMVVAPTVPVKKK